MAIFLINIPNQDKAAIEPIHTFSGDTVFFNVLHLGAFKQPTRVGPHT